ncbi:MAG: putative lipid II flippase FtsW [Candidatus Babeliales bacterium]
MINKNHLRTDLHIFLSAISILIIVGIIFIYSSSSVYALEKLGSSNYFVKKQLIGLSLGFIGLLICSLIPLPIIQKLSPYLFLLSLSLTFLTLISIFGRTIHGSSRWLGFGPFIFQPSELLKLTSILYLSYFLSKKQKVLGSFSNGYIPFFFIIGITTIVLLKQPDFGTAVTLALTAFTLFFVAHFNIKQMLLTGSISIPLMCFLILKYPYRLRRVLTFLNPWNDPQGAGFQIIQSLIAIGSGSLWGVGVSHSKQKFFYLPMLHTDFIFSIIAEETGFIGSCLLISLYIIFLYIGFRIAWQLHDHFSQLFTIGFVLLTSLQAIINISVASGLLPTKGIGLPFVSYGNSSLICYLCFVGLIINIVINNKKIISLY